MVKDLSTIRKKLRDIYEDFSYNITHIYGREDMLTAIDLVFHSILQFRFLGKLITKGWLEALIIGDTRTGKTETISRIVGHYKLGEVVTGENTSYAGLIGGLLETQKTWNITWGKIPLNNRRLVAIDEVSALPIESIAGMSGPRSTGIAEIVKIQTQKTNARTRLIWLSNTRSGRRLDSYNQGVLAVKELMGRLEDIARLDIVVSVDSKEVSLKEINVIKSKKVPHKYTSNLCNQLIIWAWSRKVEDVQFAEGVEQLILDLASELGRRYSPEIPLVEPAEERIKLARVAVAIAARLFSTDIKGEKVIVRKEHAQFAYEFLNQCFCKNSLAYDLFSASRKKREELSPKKRKELIGVLKSFPSWPDLRDLLLEHQIFRKGELIDQMGYETDVARNLFKWMGRNGLIKSTGAGYVKQPIFTNLLKEVLNDKEEKEF